MDLSAGQLLGSSERCGFCHFATSIDAPGPGECFDTPPSASSGLCRLICRAGLVSLGAPVERDGRIIAHVFACGFVTSTRERRGIYLQLVSRGQSDEAARKAIKGLQVISRAQGEAYAQIARATAEAIVDATAERMVASERVEELRLFVSAGQQVASSSCLDEEMLASIAEEAESLLGAEAAAMLRPRGSALEVVARTAGWRGPKGALVPRAGTASGRAAETKRALVANGTDGPATVAMPLIAGDRVVGVFEARVPAHELPVRKDRLARLNRFGQFVAIALEREDERRSVERAMTGYSELNSLAAMLGGQTEVAEVADIVVAALQRSFGYDIAGLVLTGWGKNRADIAVNGRVTQADLDHVLGEVSGRDVRLTPFDVVRQAGGVGEIVEGEESEDIALSLIELSFGDLNVGWLFAARTDGERYGAQDRALLEGIAAHAGAAYGRAAMYSRIRDDYAKTIAALSATLDLGEKMPSGHTGRVMEYAMAIGEELGLGFEAVEQLRFAGLLHDIGKTGVPEEILLKPSALDADEVALMRRHAEIGATVVEQIEFLKSITPIILHHHEHWDGTGYPEGLAGESIPLGARILAVADAYDAMTCDRPHTKKLSRVQARRELERQTGKQFDASVVAALFARFEKMALVGKTGLLAPAESRARLDLPA